MTMKNILIFFHFDSNWMTQNFL